MQRRYQFMEKTEADRKLLCWRNFGSGNGWYHFYPFCSFYHAESPNHQTASFRPLDLYRKQRFPSDNTYFVISGRINELAVMHQRVWLDILVCLSADDRSVTGSVLYYKKLEELAWQDFDDLHCGYGDTDYKQCIWNVFRYKLSPMALYAYFINEFGFGHSHGKQKRISCKKDILCPVSVYVFYYSRLLLVVWT